MKKHWLVVHLIIDIIIKLTKFKKMTMLTVFIMKKFNINNDKN